MEIGPVLRAAREKQAISLEVVEQETKIRKKYLIALEQENFDVIPGKVYVRGFLRNYARFLGLNGESLVEQYNNYYNTSVGNNESLEYNNVKDNSVKETFFQNKKHRRFALVAVIGVLLFAGIMLSFSSMIDGSNHPENKISQDNEQSPSPQVNDSSRDNNPGKHDNSASNGINNADSPLQHEGIDLVLTFNGRCWMQVQVDKKQTYEGFAYSGEKKEFTGQQNIVIHVGDAGVVKATVNGTEKGFLGKKGDVVKKTFWAEGEAGT